MESLTRLNTQKTNWLHWEILSDTISINCSNNLHFGGLYKKKVSDKNYIRSFRTNVKVKEARSQID
jgi:hypothetical protein